VKYDHRVKANGKYYAAGENVPETEKGTVVEETLLPFSDEDITFEEKPEGKKYTKTEIIRMNKAELQELAKNIGVEGTDEMSGAELKEYIISVFGL